MRAKNFNFITKNLRKTIVKRSKLRNEYLHERTNGAKTLYNKQISPWIFCIKIRETILETSTKKLLPTIEHFTDSRTFWKTISPLFSEKAFRRECITIKESNKTITNNEEPAETFNTFFSQIVSNLNLSNNLGDNVTNPNIADPVFC